MVVKRLLLSLQGLNSFVRRLFTIVKRLQAVQFSRELDGLQALKLEFTGYKLLNSLENLRAHSISFTGLR